MYMKDKVFATNSQCSVVSLVSSSTLANRLLRFKWTLNHRVFFYFRRKLSVTNITVKCGSTLKIDCVCFQTLKQVIFSTFKGWFKFSRLSSETSILRGKYSLNICTPCMKIPIVVIDVVSIFVSLSRIQSWPWPRHWLCLLSPHRSVSILSPVLASSQLFVKMASSQRLRVSFLQNTFLKHLFL